MKRSFVLFVLAAVVVGARADLVLQQQIVSPSFNNSVTIKVKGTKIRMDMYAGQPQAISTITDLKTTDGLTLLHNQKMFIKSFNASVNPTNSVAGIKSPPLHNTGKTEKVGGYDTEIYIWSNAHGAAGMIWVAKNFPNYAKIKADLAILDKSAANDTTPALSTLSGMAIKTQITGGGQTLTATLLSAKTEPLDASVFQTPAGYTEMAKPKPAARKVAPKAPAK